MKKRQRKVRIIRAIIQLAFFLYMPSLFSTAFAGVKSIFLAIGKHEMLTWNSFMTVTVVLLGITCLIGRHFCGYACAFGTLGDVVYESFGWFWTKCLKRKKKLGYTEKTVYRLQKVKYIILAFLLLSCVTGFYGKLSGYSPWDVFSMLTAGRLPGETYKVGIVLLALIMIGMATQERFFCQFLCPMGAIFALMPVFPKMLFKRKRENCIPKCTACKRKCPAHLDIDGDTARSGECISCHACTTACPRGNITVGIIGKKS